MSSIDDLPRQLEVRWENLVPANQQRIEESLGIYELQELQYLGHPFWVQTSRCDGSTGSAMQLLSPLAERTSIYWYAGSFHRKGWYLTNRLEYGDGIAYAAEDELVPNAPPEKGWRSIGWLSSYGCDGLAVVPVVDDRELQKFIKPYNDDMERFIDSAKAEVFDIGCRVRATQDIVVGDTIAVRAGTGGLITDLNPDIVSEGRIQVQWDRVENGGSRSITTIRTYVKKANKCTIM